MSANIRVRTAIALRSQNYAKLRSLKQKAGYKANGTLLIAIFALGFRVSRAPIQDDPGHVSCISCNKQPAGVLALAKPQRKQPQIGPKPQSR
jgi:hypothetical protein